MVPPPAETKALRTLYSLYGSDKIGAKAPNLEKLLARRNGQLRSIIRTAVYYISSSAPVDKRKEKPRCKPGAISKGMFPRAIWPSRKDARITGDAERSICAAGRDCSEKNGRCSGIRGSPKGAQTSMRSFCWMEQICRAWKSVQSSCWNAGSR